MLLVATTGLLVVLLFLFLLAMFVVWLLAEFSSGNLAPHPY